MKTKHKDKKSRTGAALTLGFRAATFLNPRTQAADPGIGGSALQKYRNNPGMSMKTNNNDKKSRSAIARIPGFGSAAFFSPRTQAAASNTGGLRYKNAETIQECL